MKYLLPLALALAACSRPTEITVCSKKFTESVLLGELATQLVRSTGAPARHRDQLGGTQILWNALASGACDAYPDYTGTLSEDLLQGKGPRDEEGLRRALAERGVVMSRSLGFNNTYAIGMKEESAARLNIRTLSDLANHPELRLGFSEEFMNRADGWPSLRDRYALPQTDVRGLDHDLAYRGLAGGTLDAIDLYSTDAEIRYYHLRALDDDRHHFPDYFAVLLTRADLATRAPAAAAALARLDGALSPTEMVSLNARAKLEKVPEPAVAAGFLADKLSLRSVVRGDTLPRRLLRTTLEHLLLVSLSLFAAILLAIPLGILAAHRPRLGQIILGATGILQTIPSLPLLVFMIPLLGIGTPPALLALFLYSLLPIVRNTCTGIQSIPTPLRESAEALGLPPRAILRLVELPLASPSILAGIKTSAVINVGTATLGAVIGAGGYGQPILTGIRLDDWPLILQGALPAALLALLVQTLFELLERALVPKGLRLRSDTGT